MEYKQTVTGTDVIYIDDDVYLSFGSDKKIKWLHLSYKEEGVRRGQMLPVNLLKLKKEYTKLIGRRNVKKLRELIITRLEDDLLTRDGFNEIANEIKLLTV